MIGLFIGSRFNGNISKWNLNKVGNLSYMFAESRFNGDISSWDVSRVKTMEGMFINSKFNGNLESWSPTSLKNSLNIFESEAINIPFWANLKENADILKAVESYQLQKNLSSSLNVNVLKIHKNKI